MHRFAEFLRDLFVLGFDWDWIVVLRVARFLVWLVWRRKNKK